MKVIVAHPDTQHSYHAAIGLKRAGLLRYLFTALSLKRPGWFAPALRTAAPNAHARLLQHRHHEGLDSQELRIFPPHLVAMRMGPRAWATSQKLFGAMAGRMAVREQCAVMAFNSNATRTFRALNREGLPAILDQTIAHRRWSNRVGQAECDSHPEWGDRWASEPWREVDDDEEVARSTLILCGSEFCAQTMVSEGVPAEKLRVVPYGADTARFTPPPEDPSRSGTRLLFVGSLALRKGIHVLLEAAMRLRSLRVKVTAVGAPNVRAEALAKYSEVLEPTGFRLHADMPTLYRSHDLYVFPSFVEGSSLSTYEALASGLPVVTTPNAGTIVRSGIEGLVVAAGDVEALTAAIERLVKDPELRREMGRAARVRATEYGDWTHYGDRLVEAARPALTA